MNERESSPRSPTEPGEAHRAHEGTSKQKRPIWKRPGVIASIAMPLIIAVFFAVLAAVGETPRLDASSEVTLGDSLQRMTAGMSDAQKKEFLADCVELTLPDTMKSAFQLAFLSNGPAASNGPRMYKTLQGMNAQEIHRKAEAARRSSRNADNHPAASPAPQPLPGIPSPFPEADAPIPK